MNAARRPLLALALAAVALPAHAGPPFVVDDPEPLEPGGWEVYVASQLSFEGGLAGPAPLLEVNHGAWRNVHLHLAMPLALSRPDGGPARWGPGDLEAGAKLRFVEEDEEGGWRPQVGVFPIVTLPTGSEARGLGEGAATVFLPLWLQKGVGSWTVYGGAGWRTALRKGASGAWFGGAVVQRHLGPVLLGVELFHETGAEGEAGTTRGGVGAVWDVGEKVHLLGAVRRSLAGAAAPDAYLGLLLTP